MQDGLRGSATGKAPPGREGAGRSGSQAAGGCWKLCRRLAARWACDAAINVAFGQYKTNGQKTREEAKRLKKNTHTIRFDLEKTVPLTSNPSAKNGLTHGPWKTLLD